MLIGMIDMVREIHQKEESSDSSARSDDFFRKMDVEFLIHELKDPLAVIETGVRILLEQREKVGLLSVKQEKILLRMLRSSRNARQMIYTLLEVGRSQAGYQTPTGFYPYQVVCYAIEDAVETQPGFSLAQYDHRAAPDKICEWLSPIGIQLDIDPSTRELKIYQDETQFRQIVGNLLKNALHHRKKEVWITLIRQGNQMKVGVKDDGPGIPREHHQLIFKRYAQSDARSMVKRKGHGLGLAGALALANCLGGDITVKSAKGSGALFELRLPIKTPHTNSV